MDRLLRILLPVLALALLAGGVILVSWAVRRPGAAVAVFPDGSRLQYVGSATGGQTFTTERPWHKLARRFLPYRWQGWIPAVTSGSCSSGSNSVTFFFRQVAPTSGPQPWINYFARDATGFRYPLGGGYCSFGRGGTALLGLSLRAYPRRERTFEIVFLAADRKLEVARVRVPNPVQGPFPTWGTEMLPLTRTNGPVTLTLASLSWRSNRYEYPLDPGWQLAAGDPAWQHTRPGWVEVEDATGNAGAYAALSEPAWRVKTSVRRERWEDFSPSEVLVVTNLNLPPAGEFTALDASAELGGCKVTLGAICGPGQLSITNGTARGMAPPTGEYLGQGMMSTGSLTVEHWGSNRPFLFLEVSGMGDRDGVFWRAFDSEGRGVKMESPRGYSFRSGTQIRVYQPEFASVTNAVISRLEIAVSRALEFEFSLDPRTAVTRTP